MYKPSWLSTELQGIIDNTSPLNGLKLGITLAKFSLTIIPPTLGAATGIIPAMRAYNSAQRYGKVKGIGVITELLYDDIMPGMARAGTSATAASPLRHP